MTSPEGTRRAADVRGIIRVFPDIDEDVLLDLFHEGARVQWTSRDLDWTPPLRLTGRQRDAMARLLTPVYFGAQAAMLGASAVLPQLMAAGETTAQLYLTSFIVDEAHHFEALTRYYRKLGHGPLGPRQLPEMLRYHHRIRRADRAGWVCGVLFSDVIAGQFYRTFGVSLADPVFAQMSTRILQDVSRHLAFADHYLRRSVATMDGAGRRALVDLRDDLLGILGAMAGRMRDDAAQFAVDLDFLAPIRAGVEASSRSIGLPG